MDLAQEENTVAIVLSDVDSCDPDFDTPMKPSSTLPSTSSDNDNVMGTTNPLYTALNRRKGSMRPQPKNTALYEVKSADTLSSIAARHNTTPSELLNLNKLVSRTLFPGQIIYVPEIFEFSSPAMETRFSKLEDHPMEFFPRPGHVERIKWERQNKENRPLDERKMRRPSMIAEDLNKESLKKFLKINVRYITDGEGVIAGVLLVTPNHLMFDPNVSDPLVIEHGLKKYSVIAPMFMVVRAALYPDIVRMIADKSPSISPDTKTMTLFKPTTMSIGKSHSLHENLDPNFQTLLHSHSESEVDHFGSEYLRLQVHKPLSSISEGLIDHDNNHDNNHSECQIADEEISHDLAHDHHSECQIADEKSSSLIAHDSNHACQIADEKFDSDSDSEMPAHPCKEVDHEELAVDDSDLPHRSGTSGATLAASSSSKKKKSRLKETAHKFKLGRRKSKSSDSVFTTYEGDCKVDELVSVTDKKDVSACDATTNALVVDKHHDSKSIPRPAKSFDDTAMYLCLRMGHPFKEPTRKVTSSVKDLGNKVKSEYWFSIPKARVDHLYWFFLRFVPEKYGDILECNLEELGYHDVDVVNDEKEEFSEPPPANALHQRRLTWSFPWKLKKVKEPKDRIQSLSIDHDFDLKELELGLPELLNVSAILNDEHVRQLNQNVPTRLIGSTWKMIYSTGLHGFSLQTMYREMANIEGHILIVIQSCTNNIFGAVLSDPLKISDHFYGTGESFLYTFYPEFKCFPWTGENSYVIKGNTGSFAVGASEGQFGLWLDDDLFHGCSKECRTFDNVCLSEEEDFFVKELEAWSFI